MKNLITLMTLCFLFVGAAYSGFSDQNDLSHDEVVLVSVDEARHVQPIGIDDNPQEPILYHGYAAMVPEAIVLEVVKTTEPIFLARSLLTNHAKRIQLESTYG